MLWGIFIYITLSGAAKGLDNGFERQFENIAMNSMFIWGQRTSIPYAGYKIGRNIRLRLSDIDYIKKTIPEVQYAVPRNSRGVFSGAPPLVVRKTNQTIMLFMETFLSLQKLLLRKYMMEADSLTKKILNSKEKFVLLVKELKQNFLKKMKIQLDNTRIDNIYFQVIGVHKFIPGGGFESDEIFSSLMKHLEKFIILVIGFNGLLLLLMMM